MKVAFVGDLDPAKVLTQMYEFTKKTIDSMTSPQQIGSAVDRMKAMGDNIAKMGIDFASSMGKAGAGGR